MRTSPTHEPSRETEAPVKHRSTTNFALEMNELSVARAGKTVLKRISFGVERREVYALLGGNGAGKSSTLLTFLGFLVPTDGSAIVDGHDVIHHREHVRRSIAYLPEAATLYPHLSARENLAYFLALGAQRANRASVEDALDKVGLPTEARIERLGTYSKGMRQKVAIALALLRDTPILLLDEPTSGLDPVAIDDFNALVRSLADTGRTVLMVTHDVYGACQVADRIGLLHNGELVGSFAAPESGRIDTEAVHSAFVEQTVR